MCTQKDGALVYQGEKCIKRVVEDTEDEVEWLYVTLPSQPMTEVNDAL